MDYKMIILILLLFSLSIIHCEPIELSEIHIREQTSKGSLILKLNSSINQEEEDYSYRFVSNNHRDIQRYFSLNSSTGEIRLANEIQRQMICPTRDDSCRFILKIFELSHEKLYHIPIIIEELQSSRPIFPYSSSQIQFHISENSPIYQSKLFFQQNYNHDYKQLKYQLKNLVENFPFILEINTDLGNRLALVLIQTLDREFIDMYNCSLVVTDSNGYYELLDIQIFIDDVNDQTPIFESDKYSMELLESTAINTTIFRVYATDSDIGLNSQIVYDFPDASKQFARIFFIDNQTGEIRLRSSLDYEQRSSYIFYIEARDCGKESRSSQTLINITVLDENDNPPMIHFRFLPEMKYNPTKDLLEISENYPIDKFFSQILLTDADSGFNGLVRFWFEDQDRSFEIYQIDNFTYFLNRTKSFDYESEQTYILKFYAEDLHPEKPLRTNKILTIDILDENDHMPQFLQSIYSFKLKENNPKNILLTKIGAIDEDHGENGRISYEIVTNETYLPFAIDPHTGVLRCLKSLDRENRAFYQFEVLARDHGSPIFYSSKILVKIQIEDINDNPPNFEYETYEFSIEENWNRMKPIGHLRVFDRDLPKKFLYRIDNNQSPFQINSQGELFLRTTIDREIQDRYKFNVTISDQFFQTTVQVQIKILDINDCSPQWIKPSENQTKILLNKDQVTIGMSVYQFQAIDRDDPSNGNGLISYSMKNQYEFLDLSNTGDLILNAMPMIGKYLIEIQAQDHGKFHQYSSMIQLNLFIGDNYTNGSFFLDHLNRINSLSTMKRVILFSIVFLSIAFIFLFIMSMIIILICRYRKQKYLYYIQCKENKTTTDRISNSSKLSLEDIHQKRLIEPSSSPSYTGTNLYHHHHHLSNNPTSDYYSNSSKQEDGELIFTDVDEWTDPIEKILYPDWLYRDILPTSTFIDSSKRLNQLSPKQVRFDYENRKHLNTTIRHYSKGLTTTMISHQSNSHNTFI